MATIFGTAGNDSWTLAQPSTLVLDGRGGTDTLSLGISLRSDYTITRGADGAVHVDSVSGASGGGLHATLIDVEILTFNSGTDRIELATFFGDTVAPALVSASPADEATDVAVDADIVLTFSETITRGSGTVEIVDAAGRIAARYDAATSVHLRLSGATLTLDLERDLAPGTAYTVTVGAGVVKDSSGNAFAGLGSYNFTTAAGVLVGTVGNDSFSPGPGRTTVDGGGGIDSVSLQGLRGDWSLGAGDGGFQLASTSASLTLRGVERLHFADRHLALDLSGHAGLVARVLGAVFGPASVRDPVYVGIGLQLADGGMEAEALMQLALDARLGTGASNADVVRLLYGNVVGQPPSDAELAGFVALLDSGAHSAASLGLLAAETELNEQNIDLVGLAATGLVFTP